MSALSLDPIDIAEGTTPTTSLTVGDLTSCEIGGTGVFDKLMTTVALYINEEFAKGRLTGKDYATVYLGGMTGVLQAAVAYLTRDKEIEKLNAEISLLRQKTVTELANTCNTIPSGLGFNNSTTIQGNVGKQMDLYTAQTSGFARDAEQKLLKVLVDTWSVRRTTDDGTVASPSNGLDDASILAVVKKAKAGIGMP